LRAEKEREIFPRQKILERPELVISIAIGLALLLSTGLISANREFHNFGTETDFILRFVAEAQKIRSGDPLGMEFHPPLYAFALSAIELLFGDWFQAGRFISWLSVLVVLYSTFVLSSEVFGRRIGLGVLATLGASSVFVAYGAMATSDLPFLAAYSTTLLLCFRADTNGSALKWFVTGLSIGLCILTRANGLVTLALVAVPLCRRGSYRQRIQSVTAMLAGVGLLPIIWGVYAAYTGSPFVPVDTRLNLVTAFYADYVSAQGGKYAPSVQEQFKNIWDVFLFDPGAIVAAYLKNSAILVFAGLSKILESPISLLILPGLFVIFIHKTHRFAFVILFITVAHIALVNFKTFEARFFLFLVPFLGLGLGKTYELVQGSLKHVVQQRLLLIVFILCVVLSGMMATYEGWERARFGEKELAASVPGVLAIGLDRDALIVARKKHLSYYTGVSWKYIPRVDTFSDLHKALMAVSSDLPIFLYFGAMEASDRPLLGALRNPADSPDWLEPLAYGPENGGWVFYRVVRL